MYNIKPERIVIIVAMESERTHLEGLISDWEFSETGVWPTMRTTYRDQPIVVIRCGIGMVAASAATEHAISHYGTNAVLNYGCAGAHARELLPGDVVIGTSLVAHGRMRMTSDNSIVAMDIPFTVPGEPEAQTALPCDPQLVRLAQQAASSISLDPWPEAHRLPLHQETGAVRIHSGVVASGDIWLQDSVWLDETHNRTGSLCEDMEAAAIAQICALHGVPFLTIKDISNNEFHVSSVFEGTESALPVNEVGKRAATLTVGTIDRMITRRSGRQD